MKTTIHCSHSAIVPLEQIVEHPRNPNKHPPAQLRLLAKILLTAGWRAPIVTSKRSGFVIKGHGRYQAAKLAGLTEVPVDIQDYASEAEEWADMIADNRIAELAEIDPAALKDLLQELDTGAFDMDLTGFDESVLAGLMTEAPPANEPNPELAEKWEVAIECDNEAAQIRLLERFKTEGLKCRAPTF